MKALNVVLLLLASSTASAEGLPACPAAEPAADWQRVERAAFALTLPPGTTFSKPPVSIDYASGTWTLADGRRVDFQYGFDVDSLDGLAGREGTTRCTVATSRGALDVTAFRSANGGYGAGFHLGELDAWYADVGALLDGVTIVATGPDASAQALGYAVARSFVLSRLPAAATGVYETPGEIAQGLSVHVAGDIAGLMWGTYDPATGEPLWMTGAGERGDVANVPADADDPKQLPYGLNVTFQRSATGRFPGRPGPTPRVEVWGSGTLRFSADCKSAELEYANADGTLAGKVPMVRLTALEGSCDRFAP